MLHTRVFNLIDKIQLENEVYINLCPLAI
jgi:hypothetical protein